MVGAEAALLAGLALGLSLAAPPGPVNVLVAEMSARRGPWSGVAVGAGATLADAGYLLLALAGAVAVLAGRPVVLGAVSVAGAGVLLWFARGSWRAARASPGPAPPARAAGFLTGFMAAATSPFNLAWWVGPGTVLVASAGLLLFAGLFAGILGWVLLFSLAVARLGRRVARLQEGLAYLSAAVLTLFAAWMAWRALALLAP